MAADYVVKLSGQDNLTSTINNVKKAIGEVGQSTSKLDSIREKFDKIQNSSAPLKRQLRDLKAIMGQMNMDGLSNTKVFEEMAEYAGGVKDAMADAGDAISRFASDTMKLEAMTQGFQLITGAASTACGVMGMMGVESDKLQRMMLKVQSAIAMVNGVQGIANALNKDSVLMHRLKQIRVAASTAATTTETVATTANTVAVGANTAATVASTAATKAWNVVKAVSKALLGDWTGLVLVGATALAAYAIATDDATDAEEEHNKILSDSQKIQQDYSNSVVQSTASLVGKYQVLRREWLSLQTTAEKTKWIENNKTAMDTLGLSVNGLSAAENIFVNNTSAVVAAFEARAKAEAAQQALIEAYKKYYEKKNRQDTQTGDYYHQVKGGDTVSEEEARKAGVKTINTGWEYDVTLNNEQANKVNAYRQRQARKKRKEYDKKNDADLKKETDFYSNIIEDNTTAANKVLTVGKNKTTPKATPHTTTTKTDTTPQPVSGSLGDMEKTLQDLQNKLKNGFIPKEAEQKTIDTITELKEKIEKEKIRLGFEAPKESEAEKEAKKYKEDLQKLVKKQGDIKTNPEGNKSSFDKAIGTDDYNTKTIDGVKNQMDFNDNLLKQLNDLKQAYEELGATGEESYQNIVNQIDKVNNEQSNLGNTAKDFKDQTEKFDRQKQSLEGLADVSSSTSTAFGAMASMFQQSGNDAAAAAMQVIGTTAQATAEIIPNIIKIIGAKQGEAMASGTASASSLPFPANIAAIASVIATIVATFANIMSAVGAFADGGIVGGGNLHGDKMLARLNSGEMVLNRTQQAKLFRTIENGNIGASQTTVSNVSWKIKGSDLYGTLQNYKTIKSKQGKNIM